MFGSTLAILKTVTFEVKTAVATLGHFMKILGYFLFQNLATLTAAI